MMIEITAPATTANLGPGFDCLGAALTLELRLSAWMDGRGAWTGPAIQSRGRPPGPDLILRAARAVAGVLPDLGGSVTSHIPIGRGLGSSASAVAAGLLLGCALAGKDPDLAELLEIGAPIEGHPDNLAPCLYGGLCLVVPSGRFGSVLRFEPTPAVRPVVLVPSEELSTQQARGVLPESVPFRDAVVTAARASGLLALLTGEIEATADRLLQCTEDVLHQPYRAKLMPRTAASLAELRAKGVPAVVSGAGPSILCLVTEGTEVPEIGGWERLETSWDTRGARMTVTQDG